jgi:hypothetical protein
MVQYLGLRGRGTNKEKLQSLPKDKYDLLYKTVYKDKDFVKFRTVNEINNLISQDNP